MEKQPLFTEPKRIRETYAAGEDAGEDAGKVNLGLPNSFIAKHGIVETPSLQHFAPDFPGSTPIPAMPQLLNTGMLANMASHWLALRLRLCCSLVTASAYSMQLENGADRPPQRMSETGHFHGICRHLSA